MLSAKSVIADLKKKGREKTRNIYSRHGVPAARAFGVSVADLKGIAKTMKGQQALACELYQTGMLEAMYLAGMVADGSQMTKKQLQAWAEGASGMQMISEYTVPWVALDHSLARDLALEWMKSKNEHIAASGWCTYAGLVATKEDKALDLGEIQDLLKTVVNQIHSAPNRARHTMNAFVIAVGSYVKPLLKQAKAAAAQVGPVSVDMGDTDCKVPLAAAYIAKVEAAGRVGRKRKTIRC
jgi:3-methyladenine DNA glycosylase AlkD